MQSNKGSLRSFAAVGLLLAGSACSEETSLPPPPQPNVVLMITDDQGWAQLGAHGDDVLQTPNLDRLSTESVELTRFYVSPVCAPTRASLMTGRYNYRTGVVDTYLGRAMMHADELTIAEILRDAGYRTGIFGKWHLGDNYPMRPQDQGFDQVLVHRGGGIGQPSDPPGTSYFDPILQHNGKEKQFEGYCTDIFFDAALRFIEQGAGQPFFTYLPTNAPHSPYHVPEEYIERYREKGLSDKDARIYGMITNIDENVGRLLNELERLGLAENTIVIFMTDNGPTIQRFTAGLRDEKTSVYEGGIRVPFLLRWPGSLEPNKIDRIAAHIDVLPTLLEATRISPPSDVRFDGMSIMPLLKGEAAEWLERTIYIQSHRGNEPQLYRAFAAVSPRFKLVQSKYFSRPMPKGASLELYDLEADPGERNNIAEQHPKTVGRLKKGYEEWFRDVSATRGHAPPRILLGTPYENPSVLTRQDWRVVGPDGWEDHHLGYWEVEIAETGAYDVHFRFPQQDTAGRAEFALGHIRLQKPFTRRAESITFPGVPLDNGPARLEARLIRSGKTVGVTFVDVTRLDQ